MSGITDFNDADRWVVETALRLQADPEKNRAGVTSGKTGADLNRGQDLLTITVSAR